LDLILVMLVFGEGVLEALGDVSIAERVDAIVDGLADESCPAEYFVKRRDPDVGWRVFAARRIPAKRVLAVYGGVIRLEGKPNGTHEVLSACIASARSASAVPDFICKTKSRCHVGSTTGRWWSRASSTTKPVIQRASCAS